MPARSKQQLSSTPPGAAGDCTVSVSQPPVLEVDDVQGAVTMPCSFSTVGCPAEPPSSLWFRYWAHRTETLCVDGCTSEADKFTVRKALAQNQVSLTVNQLTPNDSAIYICGLVSPSSGDPRAKQAGTGTVLVVRGQWSWLLQHTTHCMAFKHTIPLTLRVPQLCDSVPWPGKAMARVQARALFGWKTPKSTAPASTVVVCRCPTSPHVPTSLVRVTFPVWR